MTLPAGAVHGPLISRTFLADRSDRAAIARLDPHVVREIRSIANRARQFGPASPVRAVADLIAIPLARVFGFTAQGAAVSPAGTFVTTLVASGRALAVLAVRPFGESPNAGRIDVVRETVARRLRWALACNGRELRLVDCNRPHARRWLAVALDTAALQPAVVAAAIDLMSARSLEPDERGRSTLEEMIAASDDQLQRVRKALQQGVQAAALTLTASIANGRRRRPSGRSPETVKELFEEALTVVYRILFLMFAESRGLVPVWHPTYRDAYTIEALRDAIARGGATKGTWDALQAIARLAHRGATAGSLRVTPFNGRLFSPRHAPAVARSAIGERDAVSIVAALTLEEGGATRRRVPFVDLGVEQLGAVYERVLDFSPAAPPDDAAITLRPGGARKSTGSFYTPRSVTEFVVRRALHPLVADASPNEILSLRVLDPAMGSGAFLVATCRYLARAYETALVRSGAAGGGDFSAADRAGFRRLVAQRCLFGVDVNPMAVQLGRLSLWLCALAADKPLTFLDHRLRAGNSLAGASLDDVARQAPGRPGRTRPPTLFGEAAFDAIAGVVSLRQSLALEPDDTVENVRAKERVLGGLESPGSPLARWRALLDLWCSVWFWPPGEKPPDAREYASLSAALRGDASFLHGSARARLDRAADVAREMRFFHWTLEFPEVFFGDRRGFDAIVGNPPWDMLRDEKGDSHTFRMAAAERVTVPLFRRQLVRFTRDSGIYRAQSDAHANIYQLFVERALQLLRPGGRLGLVLPWGCAADAGSAALRHRLLDATDIDEIVGLENTGAIFPIHRALKFLILHATTGSPTTGLRCRLGIADVQALDRLPDRPDRQDDGAVVVSRELLARTSGRQLCVPYLKDSEDVRLLELLSRAGPPLGDPSGWNARFGRELNATDDRALFTRGDSGLPVIGGRHVAAFAVDVSSAPLRVDPSRLPQRLKSAVARTRLAYRDVAGPGNRMTLIAALVPAGVATTHTLFCLRTHLSRDAQLFLCALFNSYVLNFLARQRVGTHVTTGIVESLPVPRPARDSDSFGTIVSIAGALSRGTGGASAAASLHARVARLYGVDEPGFARILSTFPLVPVEERDAALRYHRVHRRNRGH